MLPADLPAGSTRMLRMRAAPLRSSYCNTPAHLREGDRGLRTADVDASLRLPARKTKAFRSLDERVGLGRSDREHRNCKRSSLTLAHSWTTGADA